MRRFFITFYVVSFMGTILNSQADEELIRKTQRETFTKVQDIMPRYGAMVSNLKDHSKEEINSMSAELQDLSSTINELIYNGTPSQGVRPTPERLAVIKYWGEQIKPYNEILAKTALQYNREAPYKRLINNSGHLLNYTLPDEKFEQVVRGAFNDESNNLVQIKKAARLLSEHRVLEESDKKLLSKKAENLSDEAKIKWMATLSGFGVHGDVVFVKKYLERLSFEDLQEDQQHIHFSKIVPVLEILGSLGDDAKALEKPLKDVQEVFQQKAPNYSGRIKEAISWIKKNDPVKSERAINGSGYLGESVDWAAVGKPSESPRAQSSFPVHKKEQSVSFPKLPEETPKTSNSRLWGIAGLLVIAIALTLLKVCKGKST